MATITTLGEQAIAQALGSSRALVIDEFMLAFVPGLDPLANPPKTAVAPDAQYIVHTQVPDKSGYIDDNRVAYSVMLQPEVGDFQFNWVGLLSAGVLVAVAYVYTASKIKTVGTKLGNVLARNMVIKFDGVKAILPIVAPAQSWMFDFSHQVTDIDERLTDVEELLPNYLEQIELNTTGTATNAEKAAENATTVIYKKTGNTVVPRASKNTVFQWDSTSTGSVSFDGLTFNVGDKIVVTNIKDSGGKLTISNPNGNINVPNGVSESSHTLTGRGTVTMYKLSADNGDLAITSIHK
jgi:hypothetical protein